MCARPHALAWAVPSMGPVSASANVAFPRIATVSGAVRSDAVLTIRNRDAVVKATAESNCVQGERTASVKQRRASTEGLPNARSRALAPTPTRVTPGLQMPVKCVWARAPVCVPETR